MSRFARTLLIVAVALTSGGFVALTVEPPVSAQPVDTRAPVPAVFTPTSTTVMPTTTTTTSPRVVTTPPTTAAPRPTVTTPQSVAPTAPVVRPPSGKVESCGWGWDAYRIDDGSLNEVTLMLDAPRRPNEAVTLILSPGGPDSPEIAHNTTTDAHGQASSTFSLSNDKRDWTVTVSARFASGSACSAPAFTIVY